ncbi:SatD family protein [Micrococcus lacusdianchii]|uniref:SatD family protein n=2 Tax=Micrococcus TaxID=1269 RepID=UPI002003CDB8|nr:SatD family protein [Micrococcus sp. JXJ CY 30]
MSRPDSSAAGPETPIPAVAVIADIVGSRDLPDRAAAQADILAAFAAADRQVEPLLGAWATVGDEFQALHRHWASAVRSVLRVALALPEGVELRFGLGAGDHVEVRGAVAGEGGPILDGSAWHRARAALETAEARATGAATAFVGEDEALTLAVDGQLLLRDHLLRRLRSRERRLAGALLTGRTQAEAATAERITQSAVSQAVSRSGVRELLALDAELASLPSSLAAGEEAQ